MPPKRKKEEEKKEQKILWWWLNDSAKGKQQDIWVQYDDATSKAIEKEYQKKF